MAITQQIECPPTGVYRDIPAETYFAWKAINQSGLKHFIRSPAHYIASLEIDDEDEDYEKSKGTITHAGLLEPARFDAEYAIGPDVDLRTKSGKEEWATFAATAPGKTLVRGKDGEIMKAVRRSVWAHEYASKILGSLGPHEICLVWRDEITGLMCKCRLDKVSLEYSFIVDLKTTGDARPDAFREQAYKLKYFNQAAWYHEGAAKCGITVEGFCIIAPELKAPHAISVFVIEQDEIEVARVEVMDALQRLAECNRAGKFPSYNPAPQPLMRPERIKRWADKESK